MIRIGITQRVEEIVSYGERRDSLDQNWIHLFNKLHIQLVPLPNVCERPVEYLDSLNLDGIILSGGNNLSFFKDIVGTAPERDEFELEILKWASSKKLPVLGVCRGFQMINYFLGGGLITVEGHVAIRHPVIPLLNAGPISRYKNVNSYHDFGIKFENLGDGLEPLIIDEKNLVEAAKHETLPWMGIMWHPEREKPFHENDLELISMIFTSIEE